MRHIAASSTEGPTIERLENPMLERILGLLEQHGRMLELIVQETSHPLLMVKPAGNEEVEA